MKKRVFRKRYEVKEEPKKVVIEEPKEVEEVKEPKTRKVK